MGSWRGLNVLLSPTLVTTVQRGRITFQIFAYRPLSDEEIDRVIALFRISRYRIYPGHAYKIFSALGREEALRKAAKQEPNPHASS